MSKDKDILPIGKLDFNFLGKLLKKYFNKKSSRVILGPEIGEDAAVIEYLDCYLVFKTDPITFAVSGIGWYAVHISANDVATRGAKPEWFQSTIILPEKKTTKELVEKIFSQIHRACSELDIEVIGGHTEVSYGIDRPIVVGSMFGEVEKNKLVKTSGAKPEDDIILTKGIVIEGTSIIAREKKELIEKGFSKKFINRCQNFLYNPGISVVKDALLSNQFEVHCMHDPTEGGLATGLYEVALASGTGFLVNMENIPVFEESIKVCNEYSLNPLKTITSGSLIVIAAKNASDKIIDVLNKEGIEATTIGRVKGKGFGLKIKYGDRLLDIEFTGKDEISKIF